MMPVWFAANRTGPSVGTRCEPPRPRCSRRPAPGTGRSSAPSAARSRTGRRPVLTRAGRRPTRRRRARPATVCSRSRSEESTVTHAVGGDVELHDRRVVGVPPQHLVAGRLDRVGVGGAVQLLGATGQPGLLARGQQHAHVGVGRHHGRDVPALGDDARPRGAPRRSPPRCRLPSSARTSRFVATALTAPRSRGRPDRRRRRRRPPTCTVGCAGSTPMTSGNVRTWPATASTSVSGTPSLEAPPGRARYIAPVSRYASPSAPPPPATRSTCRTPRVRRSRRRSPLLELTSLHPRAVSSASGARTAAGQHARSRAMPTGRPGGVLEAQVLEVDARLADLGEQPRQLAGRVRDQHRDHARSALARRRACRGSARRRRSRRRRRLEGASAPPTGPGRPRGRRPSAAITPSRSARRSRARRAPAARVRRRGSAPTARGRWRAMPRHVAQALARRARARRRRRVAQPGGDQARGDLRHVRDERRRRRRARRRPSSRAPRRGRPRAPRTASTASAARRARSRRSTHGRPEEQVGARRRTAPDRSRPAIGCEPT